MSANPKKHNPANPNKREDKVRRVRKSTTPVVNVSVEEFKAMQRMKRTDWTKTRYIADVVKDVHKNAARAAKRRTATAS